MDTMFSYNMYPLITKPTRVTHSSVSLIDNIFTNTVHGDRNVGILYSDFSDHFPIFCISSLQSSCNRHVVNNRKKSRLINDSHMNMFKENLVSVNWSDGVKCDNVNDSYNIFFEKIYKVYDNCFPLQLNCVSNQHNSIKPWITKEILKSVKRKHRLYETFLKKPSDQHKRKYLLYKNKLTNISSSSKRNYYNNLFDNVKGDLKKTWRQINLILGNKKENAFPKTMYHENIKISSRIDVAQYFNSFFVNIGTKLSSSISSSHSFQEFLPDKSFNSFYIKPTCVNEIIEIASTLKSNKACGPDGISPKVVKQFIHYFVQLLCDVFNKSFVSGIMPDSLKIAKITPIYKKNDINNIENYRPVALLSIFCKILEKIMHRRLYDFLNKCKILINDQFGFRKDFSTSLSILNLTDYILQELNSGNFCCGVFMDLSKAFDTIDHHILLKKIELLGYSWYTASMVSKLFIKS